MHRCLICNSQVKNCKCLQFAQICKTCRIRDMLDQEGNCTCCPFCGESKSKGRCSGGMTCHSSETEMLENSSTMPVPIDMQEPLGIGVLEDCFRSNYYTTILKRWSGEIMQKIIDWLNNKSGIKKHVDTVKAFNQFFDITRTKNENLID